MLVVLLSLVWGWRMVMFQLFGFYCRARVSYTSTRLQYDVGNSSGLHITSPTCQYEDHRPTTCWGEGGRAACSLNVRILQAMPWFWNPPCRGPSNQTVPGPPKYAQSNRPYTAYTLYLGIFCHEFGDLGGPGPSELPSGQNNSL